MSNREILKQERIRIAKFLQQQVDEMMTADSNTPGFINGVQHASYLVQAMSDRLTK